MKRPFISRWPALAVGVIFLITASHGWAASTDPAGAQQTLASLLRPLVASFIFGVVGIVMAIAGFKLFDWLTPFHLEKEICENKNIAVAILCGAMILGICHIIAVSIS